MELKEYWRDDLESKSTNGTFEIDLQLALGLAFAHKMNQRLLKRVKRLKKKR